MKKLLKLIVFVSALMLAVGAFAADKSLTLYSSVNLNGTQLTPGEYKVRYSINGTVADVQFLRGKKTVASSSGQVVAAPKVSRDSIIIQGNGDGTSKLVALQFANQTTSIRFNADNSGGN